MTTSTVTMTTRHFEPLKLKLMRFFQESARVKPNKKGKLQTIYFSGAQLQELFPDEYFKSISRELRQLRLMGVIDYDVLNKRKSEYQLKPPKGCHNNIKDFEDFIERHIQAFVSSKSSSTFQVKRLLHESHRNIQQASAGPEEGD